MTEYLYNLKILFIKKCYGAASAIYWHTFRETYKHVRG